MVGTQERNEVAACIIIQTYKSSKQHDNNIDTQHQDWKKLNTITENIKYERKKKINKKNQQKNNNNT